MDLSPLYHAIDHLIATKPAVLVAIDGPCASGKSTLADDLGQRYGAPVLRMDDFFLPPEKRTKEQLSIPGGNVDGQRFLEEVLIPLAHQQEVSFRPWLCKVGALGDTITVPPAPLTIVEGAYSLRPDLRHFYDLRVFLTAPLSLREERLLQRNGRVQLEIFQNRWIPLENLYFDCCQVEKCCQIRLSF